MPSPITVLVSHFPPLTVKTNSSLQMKHHTTAEECKKKGLQGSRVDSCVAPLCVLYDSPWGPLLHRSPQATGLGSLLPVISLLQGSVPMSSCPCSEASLSIQSF
ncbi:hypothetical protein GN956_G1516 [Arapaima gigas]